MSKESIILSTSNFNMVNRLCSEAMNESKMIAIIGYPGAGKTTALRMFLDKNKETSYYARVTASMTAKQFYTSLLHAIGQQGKDRGISLHDMINMVSYHMNYTPTKKLLIIDEAGKFKPKFMEYLHELRDNTMETTGIILAGPEYFQKNLDAWRNKGIVGIPELYRRINHWESLSMPTKPEVSAICEAYGVTDSKAINDIFRKAKSFADVVRLIQEYLIRLRKSE